MGYGNLTVYTTSSSRTAIRIQIRHLLSISQGVKPLRRGVHIIMVVIRSLLGRFKYIFYSSLLVSRVMDLNKLYPYQKLNAQDLTDLGFGCDLSEVGTGKTITAFGVMEMTGAKTILVVAPKSVSAQWGFKFKEFTDIKVHRPQGSTKPDRLRAIQSFGNDRGERKVLILTYEQVRLHILDLAYIHFDLALLDEIHRIGNALTKSYKAVMAIQADRRYGATATPLRSSPLQAYGIFNWLKPGCLGKNFYHFKARYEVSNAQGWRVGYKNLDELGERIKPFYVKTTMEDAGVFMPPLVEEDLVFALSTKEQKLYDQIKKEMLLEIDQIMINKIENPTNLYLSVVKLGKLQELTDSMELIGEGQESSKIDILKDSLTDNLVGGNKAIIFTRFSRMADILARELKEYNPAVITGATKDRQAEIDKLNGDPTCKVTVITTAGNEGINLERANLLYMVDVPLGSYGSLIQTIGRIKRIGQTKPMVVYYLLAEKSVDIKLKNLLLTKAEMSEKIFGSLAEVKELLQ